jgi:hypothetical protein
MVKNSYQVTVEADPIACTTTFSLSGGEKYVQTLQPKHFQSGSSTSQQYYLAAHKSI